MTIYLTRKESELIIKAIRELKLIPIGRTDSKLESLQALDELENKMCRHLADKGFKKKVKKDIILKEDLPQ